MDTKSTIPSQNEIREDEQRLPWHKPAIERLSVTLDTGIAPGGSGADLGAGSN